MARILERDRDPAPALAVQVDGEWVRIAVRRGGGVEARARRMRDGGLEAALAEAGVGGACVLVLPRRGVLVGTRTLPAGDADELNAMVALQAPLAMPLPVDETVWDAYLKRVDADCAHIDVLAVPAAAAARAVEQVEAAGLEVRRTAYGPLALMGYYRQHLPSDSGDWAYIDAGETGVEMGACSGGRLLFSRSLDFEDERGEVLREYRGMLTALEREGAAVKPSALVVGGPAGEAVAALLRQAGEEPVTVEAESAVPSLAAVCGALEEDAVAEVDLTPPAVRTRHRRRAWRAQVGRTLGLAAVCLGLLWAAGAKQVHDRQVYLDELESARRALAPQADSLRGMQRVLAAVRQQSDPRASGLEALAALAPHLPAGTSLERFDFEVGDKAEISGTGPAMSAVFQQLVPALQATGRFAGVQVHSAAKIGGRDRVSFHIGLRLGAEAGP